jgi:heme exporter protein D
MNSLSEFLNMGGYALFVWGSFLMTLVLMIAEPLLLHSRRKQILGRLRRIGKMNQEQKS